ncbi:MAG TPA: hypothetical protein VLM89_17735 [Phycisphaerae bacterium]|nr:hypothetical protein [Phycisphaerae bacterium]
MNGLSTRFNPLFFLAAVIAIPTGPAGAQSQPATQPAAAPAASPKGTLHAPYVDGSFGFMLAFPDGSEIEREKQFITPAELEIVRFVQLQHTWSLALRLATEERPLDPEAMLEKTAARLTNQLQDMKVLRSEPTRIDTREGARFACSFKADNTDWLRQQAWVRKSTREYYVLITITPLADQAVAVSVFDEIVTSFKILRTELAQERLDAALERGADLIRKLAANPARQRALGTVDTFLRYIENGKETGFRHILQTPGEIDHQPGVLVREWGWLFRDDGSFTQLAGVMFLSSDLSYAKWDSRSRAFMPEDPARNTPTLSMFGMEMGLYKDGTLLVNYTPSFNASEMKEKAIVTERSFGSPAWFAVLPQLLDLTRPEVYAFSAYDSDRRGLILRTCEVIGPRQLAVDGKRFSAIRIQDGEGLIPPINEIDVDPTGRLLRAQAGPIELVVTTQAYIEQTYKARVDAAMKMLDKHPVRLPSLPEHGPNETPQPPLNP